MFGPDFGGHVTPFGQALYQMLLLWNGTDPKSEVRNLFGSLA